MLVSGSREPLVRFRPEKVLLVEDSPLTATAISRALQRAGYRVAVTASAAEALARDGRHDAGVFDVDLGDGNGIELARELLARGTVRRAVFHTGSPDPEVRRRANELGTYVTKSGDLDELLRALRRR